MFPCRFMATKKWAKSQRHKTFIWDLKKWLLVLMFDARWWIVKCSWVVSFHLECLLPECSLKSRGVCEQPFEQTPAARCHFAQSKHKRMVSLNQRKQLGPTAPLRVCIACFGFLWPLWNEAKIYSRHAHRITENSCINIPATLKGLTEIYPFRINHGGNFHHSHGWTHLEPWTGLQVDYQLIFLFSIFLLLMFPEHNISASTDFQFMLHKPYFCVLLLKKMTWQLYLKKRSLFKSYQYTYFKQKI